MSSKDVLLRSQAIVQPPLSSDRLDIAVGAQTSHGSTSDNSVCPKHSGDLLGRIGPIMAGHVQQDVEHAGQAAVGSHDALREMSAESASF